jgi:hypothetical protein
VCESRKNTSPNPSGQSYICIGCILQEKLIAECLNRDRNGACHASRPARLASRETGWGREENERDREESASDIVNSFDGHGRSATPRHVHMRHVHTPSTHYDS